MHHLVNDIAICIVVAWLMAVGAQLLRQPLILAYMAAGFLIGPSGIQLVTSEASITTISELGLIFLLFMIGLEIDLKKMMSAGKVILYSSLAQILGCFAIGLLIFKLCGLPLQTGKLDALYLALAAALSSTVIIVKILYEKRELDTLAGRITLGVLVLQDLFAILFLAIQPNLNHPSVVSVLYSFGKVALLVAVALVASRYALPSIFRAVARLPEMVLVGALAWCFLLAGLADKLGLSREMGALVAGVGISTFPYTLDISAKVTSLRDFFVTLFFVSLGMKIPHASWYFAGWTALVVAVVLVSRFVTAFPVLFRMRQGLRASFLPSLHLSQMSELSLVIMTLGMQAGHIRAESIGIAAYSFAALAVISSYGIVQSDGLFRKLEPWFKKMRLHDLNDEETTVRHRVKPKVFMLGFSWTASSLLEEVCRKQPEWIGDLAVLDFNPQVHAELRKRGINAIYGDISQRDTLHHAGIEHAEIIICTLPNTVLKGTSNLRMLQQLRELNGHAQIITHADLFEDAEKLYTAGATYVSVPRLIEAVDLYEVIAAARQGMVEQKADPIKKELKGRREVIP